MNSSALRLLVLFVGLCTPAPSLLAQAPPSQDTFVSSSFAKTTFGSAINLAVGPGTSYVQFNLSGIPSGASVSKATLRLYLDAVAAITFGPQQCVRGSASTSAGMYFATASRIF